MGSAHKDSGPPTRPLSEVSSTRRSWNSVLEAKAPGNLGFSTSQECKIFLKKKDYCFYCRLTLSLKHCILPFSFKEY